MQAEALVLQPHSARDQPQQFRMETAAWSLLHGSNLLVAVQVIDGALISFSL